MRAAFLGPVGTFSHEALLALPGAVDFELEPTSSIRDAVLAVQSGDADGALVPLENSIEGSVRVTFDTLLGDAPDVSIAREVGRAIHHCLVGMGDADLGSVREVASHPQALAQCADYLRERLPAVPTRAVSSTAEAVELVAAGPSAGPRVAALASRASVARRGARVWEADVEDVDGNETRFAWVVRADADAGLEPVGPGAHWRTTVAWWGTGAEAPGWLVRCLSEFAFRGVNLTRIESRPRRTAGAREYVFWVDADGALTTPAVAEAVAAVADQAEGLRVLGSFPVT